jgi:hypothetical protein
MPVRDATLSASPRKRSCIGALVIGEQTRHRDVYVAKLPGHPARSLDHLPGLHGTAAQTRPNDCRDGRVLTARRSEMHVVGIERSRVAVVVVDDRQLQPVF